MYKDAQYKMAAQQEWSGVDGVSTSTFPWKKKLHGLVLKMQGREPMKLPALMEDPGSCCAAGGFRVY